MRQRESLRESRYSCAGRRVQESPKKTGSAGQWHVTFAFGDSCHNICQTMLREPQDMGQQSKADEKGYGLNESVCEWDLGLLLGCCPNASPNTKIKLFP